MSAVQARIYYAMKQEFKLLAGIIRDYTPEEYSYEPEIGSRKAKKADYDDVDVIPVSDPNAATMSQKVVQYQAVLQLSQTAPQLYDLPYLHRQMIETLGVKNADKIVPSVNDLRPIDPISENMGFLTGKPTKAFMYQDHDAHLQAHLAFLQNPMIMQTVGQNPQVQTIMAAVMAHIMEHTAFKYRREIEKQLGAALPPPPSAEDTDTYLPPQIEVQLSQLAAAASAQLLQKDVAEAQAQQAAQQAQDPLVQMQMMDLQIKQMEAQTKQMKAQMEAQVQAAEQQRKSQKDLIDAAAKEDELRLRQAEIASRTELEAARIGIDIQKHRAEMEASQLTEGAKMGLEIARSRDERGRQEKVIQEPQE
jgi:hypothetical protein